MLANKNTADSDTNAPKCINTPDKYPLLYRVTL